MLVSVLIVYGTASANSPNPLRGFLTLRPNALSILTIAWSMCAAASFMLGLLHLLLWFKDQRAHVYLLSVLMAFSAGASAMTELALMNAQSIDAYRLLLRWENLFVFTLLVPMVWFVRARLPTVSVISIIEGAVFKETEGTVDRRTFSPPASVLA